MNGWMWWPTEAEALNRGAPRSKGGHEPGSEQASPTGPGPFQPVSALSGPPDASRSIVYLLPSACGPLTSSSPWFR
jgi:hypothetical protein